MSVDRTLEKIHNLFKIFTYWDKESKTLLFEEINKEIEAFLVEENNSGDSTDDAFEFLSRLFDFVQEEFYELLSGDSDKKGIFSGHCQEYSLCYWIQKLTRPRKLNESLKLS